MISYNKEEKKLELYKKVNLLHSQLKNLGDRKIAFVLEGRDCAGKGGFVKFLMRYDVPFTLRCATMPSQSEMKNWLSTWKTRLPKNNGELVVFDRSWHTRSWVQPTMNYCTKRQYINHITNVQDWEEDQDCEIFKNWISISKEEEKKVLEMRKNFKQWKFSRNDELAIKHFNKITWYKNLMFAKSPTWKITKKRNSKIELLDHLIEATKPL